MQDPVPRARRRGLAAKRSHLLPAALIATAAVATASPGADPAAPDARVPAAWSAQEPFAASSYWKQPVPAAARYAGPDDARNRSFQGLEHKLSINTDRFTVWVWQARSSDPEVTFHVSAAFAGDEAHARRGEVTLHLPAGAHPDPGSNKAFRIDGWGPCDDVRDSDRHLIVIDPDGRRSHEFWQACRLSGDRGDYQATAYAEVDLSGDGLNISGAYTKRTTGHWHNPAVRSYGWGAPRAYGGSSLPGLIRAGEITRTGIRHKVGMALPSSVLLHDPADLEAGAVYPPATRSDFAGGLGPRQTIKHGQLFAIPRSVDLATLGLETPAGRVLARAMQEYGAVVLDASGMANIGSDGVAARADGAALAAASADLARIHAAMVAVDP